MPVFQRFENLCEYLKTKNAVCNKNRERRTINLGFPVNFIVIISRTRIYFNLLRSQHSFLKEHHYEKDSSLGLKLSVCQYIMFSSHTSRSESLEVGHLLIGLRHQLAITVNLSGFFNPFTAKFSQKQISTTFPNFILGNFEKQIAPCVSTGRELSFEWSHHRIWSTDSKVRVTLQNSIKHFGSGRVKEL